MKSQPAQGITAEQYRNMMSQLAALREAEKQRKQQAAEQCDLITPEKILGHFNTAEKNGTWSRLGNSSNL